MSYLTSDKTKFSTNSADSVDSADKQPTKNFFNDTEKKASFDEIVTKVTTSFNVLHVPDYQHLDTYPRAIGDN